jgi:hypothetical protein
MYVKWDACRFGAGKAAFNDQDPTGMGKGFVQQYYKVYQENRAGLSGLYRDTSVLIVEGRRYEGRAQITEKLTLTADKTDDKDKLVDRAMPKGKHSMDTFDSLQLAPNCVVVLVTGRMLLDGEANPIAFTQAFQLMVEPGQPPYVSNDIFAFNYSG